jgi:hypothetical protein
LLAGGNVIAESDAGNFRTLKVTPRISDPAQARLVLIINTD